ncbi:hypothetical protein SK128_009041, partial [Halocaridina rubra]
NEMDWQDILDINGELPGEQLPPVGKRMFFLKEQVILNGSSGSSKLDVKPGAGLQSSPSRKLIRRNNLYSSEQYIRRTIIKLRNSHFIR